MMNLETLGLGELRPSFLKELQETKEYLACALSHKELKDGTWDDSVAEYEIVKKLQLLLLGDDDISNESLDNLHPLGHLRDKKYKNKVTLLDCFYQEMYKALCQEDQRYKPYKKYARNGGKLLAATIGGYVAGDAGIEKGVASAIVASLLLLVATIGINGFCNYVTSKNE